MPAVLPESSPLVLSCSPRAGGNCDCILSAFLAALPDPSTISAGISGAMPGAMPSGIFGAMPGAMPSGISGGKPDAMPTRAARPLFLREHPVSPCTGCGVCERTACSLFKKGRAGEQEPLPGFSDAFPQSGAPLFGCPLASGDASVPLMRALAETSELCLVAPVYFYHLPAHLKALCDRMQAFWVYAQAWHRAVGGGLGRASGSVANHTPNSMVHTAPGPFPARNCKVILLGARQKGAKLFEGSLLTLRYALAPLGFTLAEPLLLYGLESKGDFAADCAAMSSVRSYAQGTCAKTGCSGGAA